MAGARARLAIDAALERVLAVRERISSAAPRARPGQAPQMHRCGAVGAHPRSRVTPNREPNGVTALSEGRVPSPGWQDAPEVAADGRLERRAGPPRWRPGPFEQQPGPCVAGVPPPPANGLVRWPMGDAVGAGGARAMCPLSQPIGQRHAETPQRRVPRDRQPGPAAGRQTDRAKPATAPCSGPHPHSEEAWLACMGPRKGAQGRRGPVRRVSPALDCPITGPRLGGPLLQTSSRSTNQQRTVSPPISASGLCICCASSPRVLAPQCRRSDLIPEIGRHLMRWPKSCPAEVSARRYLSM